MWVFSFDDVVVVYLTGFDFNLFCGTNKLFKLEVSPSEITEFIRKFPRLSFFLLIEINIIFSQSAALSLLY